MRKRGNLHEFIRDKLATVGIGAGLAVAFDAAVFYFGGIVYQTRTPLKIDYGILRSWELGTTLGYYYSIFIAVMLLALIIFVRRKVKKKTKMDERDIERSKSDTYGTSRFMSDDEMRQILEVKSIRETTGVILGKRGHDIIALPQETRYNRHILVFGASGSRKSRSYVRPAIFQSVLNGQSIIVTDPKGELARDMAPYCRAHGYNVKIYNLVNPKYSDSWACMDEVRGDVDRAAIFADVIISNIGDNNANQFWTIAAQNLLKALVLYVSTSNQLIENGNSTIGEAYRILVESSEESLFRLFERLEPGHPAHWPFNIYKRASDTVRESVRHELGIFLEVFQNENVRNITAYPEIDLTAPGKEKCAYFVIMSDQHSTLEFLSSMFFSFLFIDLVSYADEETTSGVLPVPVNMILDEFPNIGEIPGFMQKLATVRGRHINISIIFQSLVQIMDMYPGKLYENMLNNCDTHLCLGANDPSSAKYISERAGVMGVTQRSIRTDRKNYVPFQLIPDYKLSEGEGKRNLLNIDEVYTFDNDKAIVFIRGKHPLVVEKFDFTEHPESKHMVQERPSDHVPDWKKVREEKEAQQMQHTQQEQNAVQVGNVMVDMETGEVISENTPSNETFMEMPKWKKPPKRRNAPPPPRSQNPAVKPAPELPWKPLTAAGPPVQQNEHDESLDHAKPKGGKQMSLEDLKALAANPQKNAKKAKPPERPPVPEPEYEKPEEPDNNPDEWEVFDDEAPEL
jgi:type IV secretion system protein VirD4